MEAQTRAKNMDTTFPKGKRHYIQKALFDFRWRTKMIENKIRRQIETLREQSFNINEIATKLNLKVWQVNYLIKRLGLPKVRRGRKNAKLFM